MAPPIGFVLLTFDKPEQTFNLIRRLSKAFNDPPIALHHNFGLCALDRSALPSNVCLVEKWIATEWGKFSVVEANRTALQLLVREADPDWCVYLSGSDYPIKPAKLILDDLASTNADALLDTRELRNVQLPPDHVRNVVDSFRDPEWEKIAYQRYVAIGIPPYRWAKKVGWPFEPLRIEGRLATALSPLGPDLRPYGGDCWYTVNRRAARVITEDSAVVRKMRRHFLHRSMPEESYFHSILCNQPDLVIDLNNRRFSDWSNGGSGPRLLNQGDIPAMLASDAHFARKFPFDRKLLAKVDTAVGAAFSRVARTG